MGSFERAETLRMNIQDRVSLHSTGFLPSIKDSSTSGAIFMRELLVTMSTSSDTQHHELTKEIGLVAVRQVPSESEWVRVHHWYQSANESAKWTKWEHDPEWASLYPLRKLVCNRNVVYSQISWQASSIRTVNWHLCEQSCSLEFYLWGYGKTLNVPRHPRSLILGTLSTSWWILPFCDVQRCA